MRSSPLAGVRVLLVDDDELVREALHDYFVECGAVVVAAASARAALKAFMQAPPDVLVSDLRMPPGEDGFWLIAAIRALKPSQGGEVPAVAVTGDVMAASQAMAAGFQAVHGKPPKLPDLAALVGGSRACPRRWGAPRWPPIPPNTRGAPAKPWHPSILREAPSNMSCRGFDPRRPALAGRARDVFLGRAVAAVRW